MAAFQEFTELLKRHGVTLTPVQECLLRNFIEREEVTGFQHAGQAPPTRYHENARGPLVFPGHIISATIGDRQVRIFVGTPTNNYGTRFPDGAIQTVESIHTEIISERPDRTWESFAVHTDRSGRSVTGTMLGEGASGMGQDLSLIGIREDFYVPGNLQDNLNYFRTPRSRDFRSYLTTCGPAISQGPLPFLSVDWRPGL
jgi:hypothetical protein